MAASRNQRGQRWAHGAMAASLLAVGSGEATAQEVQRLRAAGGPTNFIAVHSARTLGRTGVTPGLLVHYGHEPLVAVDGDDQVVEALVATLATADLTVNVSVGERFDVTVGAPIHHLTGTTPKAGGGEGVVFGDLRLVPKVRIATLGDQEEGASIAFGIPISAPTGDRDRLAGEGQVTAQPLMLGEVSLGATRLAINAGVLYRPEERVLEGTRLGSELSYAAALAVQVAPEWTVIAEVLGARQLTDGSDPSRPAPLEALVAGRWGAEDGPQATAGLGAGVVGEAGTPTWRALLGLTWSFALGEPPRPAGEEPGGPAGDEAGVSGEAAAPNPATEDGARPDQAAASPAVAADVPPAATQAQAPSPTAAPPAAPVTTASGVVIQGAGLGRRDHAYFAVGSAELTPRAQGLLDRVVQLLEKNPDVTVELAGHTDDRESREPEALAGKRCEAVRAALVARGVVAKRMSVKAVGAGEPIASNGSAAGRSANRRVEFRLR